VEPDAIDLDDTVVRPSRPPRPRQLDAAAGEDLEKTITVQRPPRRGADPAPVALVEPPAVVASTPRDTPPDVSDNVWSQPVPEPPRPSRLRLGDGTIVPLDQPVYLGRKPSVPRIHPGGVPLLVTLDSPQLEVSSTHLELSMVGAAIVASDTRSTNGSVLRVPGAAPRTLIGGESVVVIPGTVIELGDGNLIELLGPDSGPDQDPASADSTGARP
jgi:hypothetical protein